MKSRGMKRRLASSVVAVLGLAASASAAEVLIPNGSFENEGPSGGFSQVFDSWTVSFVGTSAGSPPFGEHSGRSSTFGKWAFPPHGGIFATLANLGRGTVTLTTASRFLLTDRALQFHYAYITNDAPGAGPRDEFRVVIRIYDTADTLIATVDQLVANQGQFTDSGIGTSPYRNTADTVYNNTVGSSFNLVNIDLTPYFGSYARVDFVVNNLGPAAGTGGNGAGVSGIFLDNVLLTPEPSTIALFGAGLLGLGGFAWRRRGAKRKV